mgnify:CR=1 FL=1
MSKQTNILNAFRRYRRGERSSSRPARTWLVQDPETQDWVGAKQIWALRLGVKARDIHTSDALRGLKEYNVTPFGPNAAIRWEELVEQVESGKKKAPPGRKRPARIEQSVMEIVRDPEVSLFTRARAKGVCEGCEAPAPFKGEDGIPFLEVHHVKHLSCGGWDKPENTVALCPNCHRRAHHSEDRDQFTEKLKGMRRDEH